jgi:3-hydroxymyristoyl/3-hydroxydecanoyl-(acyl carrier protein) dehydratase
MAVMWYKLKNIEKPYSGPIVAEIQVLTDSPWFSGHFPGQPILPGIAQLGMVFDAICHFGNPDMKITHISRVRFKQMIRPDDHLHVIVTPQKGQAGSYAFRIMMDTELACSGLMKVETKGEG